MDNLISNDQLVFILRHMYPDLVPGNNYRVWRQFSDDTFKEQVGDAEVYEWNTDKPRPSAKAIRAAWDGGLSVKFDEKLKADAVILDRDGRLAHANDTVSMLEDAAEDTSAWRAYRQALRDVPNQPGFPHVVDWPAMPAC